MGRNKDNPLSALGRKLFRRSHNSADTVFVVHTNNGSFIHEESHSSTKEDLAAITIQACSRGHLARRAYRALRSLVKLQALVRGVGVRKQARLALDCMHALARLHISVRTRQILLTNN